MSSYWPSPIFIQIGPIAIHWYGLMYVLTFLIGYFILQKSKPGRALPLTSNQKDNLLITLIAGIILGSRLGYIIFYNATFYLANPLKILAIWEGGLSFHGGVIGTFIATLIFVHWNRKTDHKKSVPKTSFFQITDIVVLITPIGIMLGRIGNFINAELYGRISPDGKFCLNFPTDPTHCRYPSQLFESASEGLLLLIIMFALSRKPRQPGQLSGIFLILYGIIRFINEFFREPDVQLGFIAYLPGLSGITMGQILSTLLILAGITILIVLRKTSKRP